MSAPILAPELLRTFVAVADRRSFTRAAAALNRTQATVSLRVKRLEERLGMALFHRSTTHVELTAAGQDFLTDARQILAVNECALARLARHHMAERVRIGVMEDYGTRVLPSLLADARIRFPLIHVEMDVGLTSKMLDRLGSSYDVVIAMHPAGAKEGEFIRSEQAIWATAPNYATEKLDPLPVALSDPGCLFREWAVRALDKAGRAWQVTFVSRSLTALEAIVAQGLAVTVVKGGMIPPGLRAVSAGVHVPPLPDAEIRLHRRPELNQPACFLAEYLAQGLRAGIPGSLDKV